MPEATCDIGLIGLAVMGQNLVLNMNDHGFKVAVFNRTVSKVDDFLANEAKGTQVTGAHSIEEFVGLLKSPRRVMLMVKAGDTVDQMIDHVLPFLSQGDIVIDGGNSLFTDSNRRTKDLAGKGILFIGTGVSGGEEGARFGPSIMPGGNPEAWPHVKDIFQSIAAKVDENGQATTSSGKGTPCCDWVGDAGAGHYVKMVHNGIEYGDMQLICEAYDLLKHALNLTPDELSGVFTEWNKGELDSYLIEISSQIFAKKDEDGTPIVDKILDTAGQKGTGKWTVESALDLGMPVTLIGESVFARCLSAIKEERVEASKILQRTDGPGGDGGSRGLYRERAAGALLLEDHLVRAGLYAVARGGEEFRLAREHGRHCADVARRLHHSQPVPGQNQRGVRQESPAAQSAVRQFLCGRAERVSGVVAQGGGQGHCARRAGSGVFDGAGLLRRLPDGAAAGESAAGTAGLLRSAHLRARGPNRGDQFFHTNWTGRGGRVSSGTYNA
jgi:6-phosphogluconate dehydrogenase